MMSMPLLTAKYSLKTCGGPEVVVVVDPTPPMCCQQSPAPEIMWQPAVSPPRWQGKAPLCRDSSRGPG